MSARAASAIVALAIALAGCADSPRPADPPADPPPPWATELPRERGMLFAAGSGQHGDREAALAAARTELASEIEVSIAAARREAASGETAIDATGRRVERWDQSVRAEGEQRVTQANLPGVTVREARDTRDRTWVLVAMDRAAWAEQLRGQLAALDQRIIDTAATTEPEAQPAAAAARRWLRIAPLIGERSALADRLRLAAGEEPPQPPLDLAAERAELARRLGSVSIRLALDPEVEPAALEACAAHGLSVVSGETDGLAPLLLHAGLEGIKIDRIGDEYRCDGRLVGSLDARERSRSLAAIDLSERTSGLDSATLKSRLGAKCGAALAEQLDRNLLIYIARW
jgi:hypothetical protein